MKEIPRDNLEVLCKMSDVRCQTKNKRPASCIPRLAIKIGSVPAFFLALFFCSGCFTTQYNLATERQETLMYDTEKEVRIGTAYAAQINKKFEMNTDIDVNERVEKILHQIVSVCDRQDLVYFIKIIEKDDLNAVSLPGGYVYVFKGIIDAADTDAQLASVIAHEVGHITARHGIKKLQAAYGATLVQVAAAVAAPEVAGGTNLALNTIFSEYSQEDEYEADRLAVKYMKKAGYDPQEMVTFFEKLKKEHEDSPIRTITYWKSHPHPLKRMANVRKVISGKLEFRDYVILTEE